MQQIKVASCCFTKHKLHHICLMSKFSEILILAFIGFCMKFFPIAVLSLLCIDLLSVITYIFNSFFRKKYHIIMAIICSCSFQLFFYVYTYMSIQPYQFELLYKCSGNAEEGSGDKGEASYLGEYNEHNLETQLLLADRMNLDSVKECCTFEYCSVMP